MSYPSRAHRTDDKYRYVKFVVASPCFRVKPTAHSIFVRAPVAADRSTRTFGPMTTRFVVSLLLASAVVLWPSDAHAQKIPWIVLPLAAAPMIAVVFCVALGLMTKSWIVGLGNTSLVFVWGIWFVVASKYSDSDFIVWTSIAALGLHLLTMASLVVQHAIRRARIRRDA